MSFLRRITVRSCTGISTPCTSLRTGPTYPTCRSRVCPTIHLLAANGRKSKGKGDSRRLLSEALLLAYLVTKLELGNTFPRSSASPNCQQADIIAPWLHRKSARSSILMWPIVRYRSEAELRGYVLRRRTASCTKHRNTNVGRLFRAVVDDLERSSYTMTCVNA